MCVCVCVCDEDKCNQIDELVILIVKMTASTKNNR